jgi:hypothetical protein
MNTKIILGIVLIPVGALLLNACGSVDSIDVDNKDNGLVLDEVSDNWNVVNGIISEYGQCDDGWDNDGDGLIDSYDPDCHIAPGPLADLSLYDFPVGHNFFPDVSKIYPGGPGYPGGFRDWPQMTRWFRFLTDPYGEVEGYDLFDSDVDPTLVPIPAPLEARVNLGTSAQGNNNNLDIYDLNMFYLEYGFLPGLAPTAVVPASIDPFTATGIDYAPLLWDTPGVLP